MAAILNLCKFIFDNNIYINGIGISTQIILTPCTCLYISSFVPMLRSLHNVMIGKSDGGHLQFIKKKHFPLPRLT